MKMYFHVYIFTEYIGFAFSTCKTLSSFWHRFFGFLLENMVPEEERREWHSCVNIKVEYSKMNRS